MICALDNKPEVRQEIQSLADKIGKDYDTARIIYECNNGYSLDKAPNGAKSKLYYTLLEHYNGDEKKALTAKAKTYLQPFFDWFGDWTDPEATDVSKVVDENGEPLMVYHHTDDENLNEFSTEFDNYFAKTGGTKKAIFFDENATGTLNRKYDLPVFLNIRELTTYVGTKDDLHKQGTDYREVVNISAKNNDITGGLHMSKFDDNRMEDQSIWIIHHSNQVKSIDNQGTFSTTDNRIHYYNPLYDASDSVYTLSDSVIEDLTTYPAEGDYTAKDFMQRMLMSEELFNDSVQQQIALKLFEKGLEGATVVFSNDSNYWMKYHDGVITVSISSFGLNPYEFGHKFMHEVTHHYTEAECEKGGALYDIIKQLRENIEQHVSEEEKKDRLFYGLTDNHEFASEIYTNPFFRDEVVKRYAPKLWRKLLSKIFKFFGFNKIADKINVTPEYLMNELSKVIDNVTGNPLTDQLVGEHIHYYAPQVLDEIRKQASKEAEKVRKGLNTRLKAL